MTWLLLALGYGAGFAFMLGYARGHDSSLKEASWADAFLLAMVWPVSLAWFGGRYFEGRSRRWIALAIVLAAAAPARAATFTLTVSTAGPHTTDTAVASSPAGISCPPTCSAAFAAGSTVTLTAVWPSTTAFAGWGGANGCRTNGASCAVPLPANAAVSATFDPTLSLEFSGNGLGLVTSTGVVAYSSAAAAGAARVLVYPLGATVVLHESTGATSGFTGWSGDGGCATASTCTVTLNGSEVIVATFTADGAGPYRLAVSVPRGGGNVTSSPAGINTSAGVFVSTFAAGASVTMTTAALAGYRFAGWSNAGCSGRTPCVVSSTSPLQGLGGYWSPAAYFYPLP